MKNHSYFENVIVLFIVLVQYYSVIISSYQEQLYLDEGDVCQKGYGEFPDHVCKRAVNCSSLEMDISRQKYPRICSFLGNEPVVCCSPVMIKVRPPSSSVKPAVSSYSATEMCRQYSELVYKDKQINRSFTVGTLVSTNSGSRRELDCYNVKPLIVGGTNAYPKEFPHMALIGYGYRNRTWGCGGSLISNRWILSAAHCMNNTGNVASWARLGDLNTVSTTNKDNAKEYEIVEIVVHSNYNPSYVYNDIALYRLETDVEISAHIRPLCLNTNPSLRYKKASTAGWGRTTQRGQTSPSLLRVDLLSIPFDQCKHGYPKSETSRVYLGLLEDSMICAGDFENGTSDTCTGDSGGPLQIWHPNYTCMYIQIGITSFGKYCGSKDTAGVYTKVSNYIDWIEQTVWPKIGP